MILRKLRHLRDERYLRSAPWDDTLWQRACELAVVRSLTPPQQQRLRRRVQLFLRDKSFFGAHGFVVNAWMRLRIASEACRLILNTDDDPYAGLYSIVVYDGDYVVRQEIEDDSGFTIESDEELQGESLDGGPLVLSWPEIESPSHVGGNLVLHEFAHKLDLDIGTPRLRKGMSHRQWQAAFTSAFQDLCRRDELQLPSTVDTYGATDPREFFAVCTETYFMAPDALAEQYPEVFAQLCALYDDHSTVG